MEYILTLTFNTEVGKQSSLTITGVKSTITQEEVNTLMDTVLTNNIFTAKNGSFVSKANAQLTERKITKYEV